MLLLLCFPDKAFPVCLTAFEYGQTVLKQQALSDHRQGKHAKIISLIDDELIRSCCLTWLRSQRNDLITALSFSKWVCEHLSLVAALPRPVSISERTAVRWLKRLHYKFGEYRKGLYCDGHEDEEIVKYRDLFLDRMKARLPFMATFEGDDMSVMKLPNLIGDQKRIVLVTHDESYFESHDGKR